MVNFVKSFLLNTPSISSLTAPFTSKLLDDRFRSEPEEIAHCPSFYFLQVDMKHSIYFRDLQL